MNFNLLAAGLLASFGVITACALTYIAVSLFSHDVHVQRYGTKGAKSAERLAAAKRRRTLHVLYAAIISLVASVGVAVLVHELDKTDKLPADLWLMSLPAMVSLVLFGFSIKYRRKTLIMSSSAVIVLALAFSALLINSYYRLYPTFYSFIGIENRIAVMAARQATTFQRAKTAGPSANIESQLYGFELSTAGHLSPLTIPGKVSQFNGRPGWAYVPAVARGNVKLPVIILLAGTPGAPSDWLAGGGLQQTLDTFAKNHHGITPMVFVVDENGSQFNDTECVDSPRGNVETYLTQDVPNYIESHYNVLTTPNNWAIGGLSLGGMCGIMLTLRHPQTFGYFADFGGEPAPEVGSEAKTISTLFNGSQREYEMHDPATLLKTHHYANVGGYFVVGKGDSPKLVASMQTLYDLSKHAGANTVMETIGGEHDFGVWQQSFKDALPWLANQVGATQCAASCN